MAANNVFNIAINLTVNNRTVTPGLQRVQRQVQQIGNQVQKTNNQVKELHRSFENFGEFMEGAFVGIVLAGVISQLTKAVELGQQLARSQRNGQVARNTSTVDYMANQELINRVQSDNRSLDRSQINDNYNIIANAVGTTNADSVIARAAPAQAYMLERGIKDTEELTRKFFEAGGGRDSKGVFSVAQYNRDIEQFTKAISAAGNNAVEVANQFVEARRLNAQQSAGARLSELGVFQASLLPGGGEMQKGVQELLRGDNNISEVDLKRRQRLAKIMGWTIDGKTGALTGEAAARARANPLEFLLESSNQVYRTRGKATQEDASNRLDIIAPGLGALMQRLFNNPDAIKQIASLYETSRTDIQAAQFPPDLNKLVLELTGSFRDLYMTLSQSDAIKDGIKFLTDGIVGLNNWAKADAARLNTALKTLAGGLALVGTALVAITGAGLVSIIGRIFSGGLIARALSGAASASGLGPWGMVAGAIITALGGALIYEINNIGWGEVARRMWDGFTKDVGEVITGATGIVLTMKDDILADLDIAKNAIEAHLDKSWLSIKDAFNNSVNNFTVEWNDFWNNTVLSKLEFGKQKIAEWWDYITSPSKWLGGAKPVGFSGSDAQGYQRSMDGVVRSGGNQPIHINHVTTLDGRVIAESTNEYNAGRMSSTRFGTVGPSTRFGARVHSL